MSGALDVLDQLRDQLRADDVTRQRAYDARLRELSDLRDQHADLLAKHAALQRRYDDEQQRAVDNLQSDLDALRAEHVELLQAHARLRREVDERAMPEPPAGSVVLDKDGDAWQQIEEGRWRNALVGAKQGATFPWEHLQQYAPLRLLHEGN